MPSSSSSSVAVRRSIRWVPGLAAEPTDTLVLSGGQTGVFVDVRFLKGTARLDWAFAGYRRQLSDGRVQFEHRIDSRTLDPLSVIDIGTNTALENGETLEVGEMVNPDTGLITPYEEIWEEKQPSEPRTALFICNTSGTAWRAQVGGYQVGLGRRPDGGFWAWQGVEGGEGWRVVYATDGGGEVVFLPVERERIGWAEGREVEWNGDVWNILEME